MSDQACKPLINQTEDSYGKSFKSDLLEQYKLYVQSTENNSTRRVASSRYLLTLNAAIVALYGLQSTTFGESYWALFIPLVGLPSAVLWHQIIKSFRNLNTVKFGLIHEIEQHLPAAPFRYEWHVTEQGKGKVYNPVTHIERWLPLGFALLHMVLTIIIILEAAGLIDWAS